jgi:DNA (cytosine-5)-methyltransferase 1
MVLRIATDCSGIEAPIEALKQMKIPFKHVWSCDNDRYVQQSIAANYSPELFFPDITTRDNKKLPNIDMYVCGFPCQPFSALGKQHGTLDPKGTIMYNCIDVIQKKKPKIFILENVKRFKTIQQGKPFDFLIKSLRSIKQKNKLVYNVYHMILNTKDYGIPQSRNRLFIIGIYRDYQKHELNIPKNIKMKVLDDFILDKTINNMQQLRKNTKYNLTKIKWKSNYICTDDKFNKAMEGICPTLTAGGCNAFYHTTYKRYLTKKECLLLQGFRKNFKQVVSDAQFFKQIGNSMSVNVLKKLFNEIFRTLS